MIVVRLLKEMIKHRKLLAKIANRIFALDVRPYGIQKSNAREIKNKFINFYLHFMSIMLIYKLDAAYDEDSVYECVA